MKQALVRKRTLANLLDSDIDLMFLADSPSVFRQEKRWIDKIQWAIFGVEIDEWEDENYGVVWSHHVYLDDATEIEFGFGSPSWVSIEPVDEGILRVISDGCQILYAPKNLLSKLVDKVKSKQSE